MNGDSQLGVQASIEKWNARFAAKPTEPPNCPPHLLNLFEIDKGSLLDVACGDGAASLAFAKLGWRVTAMDFSSVSLKRLATFASHQQTPIESILGDVNSPMTWATLPVFNAIVMLRFKPSHQLIDTLIEHLAIGGHLLISSFNELHHLRNNFSLRFVLKPQDMSYVADKLTLLTHRSDDIFDTYLYRRDK